MAKDARAIFLRRLQLILDDRGMTREGLATKLELHKGTVSHWFGKRQSEPDFATIGRIADALECELHDFFVDSDKIPGRKKPLDRKARLRYLMRQLADEAGLDDFMDS